MNLPHGSFTDLEIRQLELDLFEIGHCLLFYSKNLHLLVDHTLPQRGVFRLCATRESGSML